MKIKLILAWYDFWVGVYWDRRWKRLYILPFPMIGLRIDFNPTFYYGGPVGGGMQLVPDSERMPGDS